MIGNEQDFNSIPADLKKTILSTKPHRDQLMTGRSYGLPLIRAAIMTTMLLTSSRDFVKQIPIATHRFLRILSQMDFM